MQLITGACFFPRTQENKAADPGAKKRTKRKSKMKPEDEEWSPAVDETWETFRSGAAVRFPFLSAAVLTRVCHCVHRLISIDAEDLNKDASESGRNPALVWVTAGNTLHTLPTLSGENNPPRDGYGSGQFSFIQLYNLLITNYSDFTFSFYILIDIFICIISFFLYLLHLNKYTQILLQPPIRTNSFYSRYKVKKLYNYTCRWVVIK